jgi:hypothetical protein
MSATATHRHKRMGEVVLLQSTAELAQVSTSSGGEKLWVKLTDLSELANDGMQDAPPKKRRRKTP